MEKMEILEEQWKGPHNFTLDASENKYGFSICFLESIWLEITADSKC